MEIGNRDTLAKSRYIKEVLYLENNTADNIESLENGNQVFINLNEIDCTGTEDDKMFVGAPTSSANYLCTFKT